VTTPQPSTTVTLVEFLRAREAEREQAAQAALQGPWVRGTEREHLVDHVLYGQSSWSGHLGQVANFEVAHNGEANVVHIARHDPAWVLHDVAIKRRIIDTHEGSHECPSEYDNCGWAVGDCTTLRLLALSEAGHPDYRAEEWKP
jgi:hypothetical protein